VTVPTAQTTLLARWSLQEKKHSGFQMFSEMIGEETNDRIQNPEAPAREISQSLMLEHRPRQLPELIQAESDY